MKRFKAGSLNFGDEEIYYTDDFITFYSDDDFVLSEDDLVDWSAWLNSPWSQTNERYVISANCKDSYTLMDEN